MPGKFTKTVKKIDNESEFAADRQPSQPAVRENDANAERKRRSKKTVIILIAVSVAFVALYFGIQGIASLVKERIRREEAEKKGSGTSKISFYPVNYSENIENDETYMGLDRNIYFEEPGLGTRYAVDTETLEDVSESYRSTFAVLVDYLEAATAGDAERLNSLFSDYYYSNGGKTKSRFTQQKIYDMVITLAGDATPDLPGTDVAYYYKVEYKIRMNNGTFRNDMGSDGSKFELFAVSVRGGEAAIDAVQVYKTSN